MYQFVRKAMDKLFGEELTGKRLPTMRFEGLVPPGYVSVDHYRACNNAGHYRPHQGAQECARRRGKK